MLKTRLIAVIILRDGQVVQSVKFKHTNVIHYDAIHAIETFNRWSVDEIVLLNVSRSPDGREQFSDIVKHVSASCFVPLAVGGWIDSMSYADTLLRNGADKLVVNTIVHTDHQLVKDLVAQYGSQCIVASIDFENTEQGPEVSIDRAQQLIGISPVEYAKNAEFLGVGEILLNCVQHDGNRKGYALDTLRDLSQAVDVPVIAFGGVFRWKHLVEGVEAGADAVAAANIFHYTEHSTKHAKRHMSDAGILVRNEGIIK